MYKKSVMHVQSCCFAYKTYCFLTFSSPSASLDLKVPKVPIRDLTKLRRRRQGERQKSKRFNEQNNNSARASRFFVHFFAVPAQLRREMTKF